MNGSAAADRGRRRLRWLAVFSPLAFVVFFEYARYALGPVGETWIGHLLLAGVVLMGALFLYGGVFGILDATHRNLERKNRELEALRSATLDITAELALAAVLQKVVDHARSLIGARYGALAVVGEDGRIETFVTSGLDDETRERIGAPPTGRGLLGVALREGQTLRVADISADPRACGFPAAHPAMRSLLAAPIGCRSPFEGNLYLSNKLDDTPFDEEDEATLVRFAAQAAVAIDNAELHRRVRSLAVAQERLRIARELHDGQAQVLAYVNTKAQAVLEFLHAGRSEEAARQLEQLAAAAREVYADVREGIFGLRTTAAAQAGLAEGLREHVRVWREHAEIAAEVVVEGKPRAPLDVELQLLRIVHEALSNVRKHAQASRVVVTVAGADDGSLSIRVEDDGVGFHPDAIERRRIPRFGLATMRERAQAIGAAFRIASEPTGGTRIEVDYPDSGRAPGPGGATRSRAEAARMGAVP